MHSPLQYKEIFWVKGYAMEQWTTSQGQHIYRLLGGRVNVFLIESNGRFLLVDTAMRRRQSALLKALKKTGVTPHNLAALILTHTHFDHAQNCALVSETFQVPVIAHESEAAYLKSGDSPLPKGTILPAKLLMRYLGGFIRKINRYAPLTEVTAFGPVFDLNPLGFDGKIIHTPGHSKGSVTVVLENEIALTGDSLYGQLPGNVFPAFADDTKLMVTNWKMLLDMGCSVFLPAHGRAISRRLLEKEYARYARKLGLSDDSPVENRR